MLLETYSTLSPQDLMDRLPKFLNLDEEVFECRLCFQFTYFPLAGDTFNNTLKISMGQSGRICRILTNEMRRKTGL